MIKMRSLKQHSENERDIMPYDEMLPHFSLTDKQIPEAQNWQIGQKYKLEIEVEMVGSRKEEYSKDKRIDHSFKITKVGVEEDDEEKLKATRGNFA